MRCPICKAEGLPHTLSERRVSPLPIPPNVQRFYDEADKLHVHDHDTVVQVYTCSNGHNFRHETRSRCVKIDCGWNDDPLVQAGIKGMEKVYEEQIGGSE